MRWNLRYTTNKKLGSGAWAVTLDRGTCPESCNLRGAGCYAELGPIGIIWRRVTAGEHVGGTSAASSTGWPSLITAIERHVPRSASVLRIGDAGDPGSIDLESARRLGMWARRSRVPVIMYSHALGIPAEVDAALSPAVIVRSHEAGSPIPASGPVAVVVRPESWGGAKVQEVQGRTIRRCPAEYSRATCASCRWCARPGVAVGFSAHGSRRKALAARLG